MKYAFAKLIVIVFKVTTDEMVADIFTKPVDEATFIKMRAVLLNMVGERIAKAKVSRLVDALYDARCARASSSQRIGLLLALMRSASI